MTETKSGLIKFIGNILGVLFFCAIIAGVYALFSFLYARPTVNPVPPGAPPPPERFSKSIEQKIGSERFHELDALAYSDVMNAPVCLRCHGNFCHDKSEKLRSFYNMHTFFLACETCHLRPAEGEGVTFSWFDDKTGALLERIQGTNGNYGAKIVPVRKGSRLDVFPKEALALEYMAMKDTFSEDEKKKKQEEMMAHITKEPITCEECHQKKGYLDYAALGYDQLRSAELSRIEIIKVSKEYGDFFLPTMFDPSVVKGKEKKDEKP